MSNQSITACEQCGNRTDDHYDELGWIRLASTSGTIQTSISQGRQKNRHAKTSFQQGGNVLDFCRFECLKDWMWKKKRPAQGKGSDHA